LSLIFSLAIAIAARKGPPAPVTTTTTTATTTTTPDDSTGYGSTIAALTSYDDVETLTDYCGDDAISYYEEYETSDYRYVIISGVPSHAAEYDQENPNPNTRRERWQWAALPLTWAENGADDTKMGATGYIMSGTVTYDHRSSPQGELASYYEWDSLDPSYGHSDQDKQYHYHAVPTEYSSAADTSACEHIGYMLDGAKLYGLCEVNGVELKSCYQLNDGVTEATTEGDYTYVSGDDCLLDNCNMYEYNGEMAYFITSNYPYVPPCLKGTVSQVYGFTPSIRA